MFFELIQFRWFRKWWGGTYYKIDNWLPMTSFWSDKMITSCGGRVLNKEEWTKKKK